MDATGAEMGHKRFFALLVEVYGKLGQTEEGFVVLDEAINPVHEIQEGAFEADLYRLRGEFVLQKAKGKKQKLKPTPNP